MPIAGSSLKRVLFLIDVAQVDSSTKDACLANTSLAVARILSSCCQLRLQVQWGYRLVDSALAPLVFDPKVQQIAESLDASCSVAAGQPRTDEQPGSKRLQQLYQDPSSISGSSFASFYRLLQAVLDAQAACTAVSGSEAPRGTLTQLARYLGKLCASAYSELSTGDNQENDPQNAPKPAADAESRAERPGVVIVLSPIAKTGADLAAFLDLAGYAPLCGPEGPTAVDVCTAWQQMIPSGLQGQYAAAGLRLCWLETAIKAAAGESQEEDGRAASLREGLGDFLRVGFGNGVLIDSIHLLQNPLLWMTCLASALALLLAKPDFSALAPRMSALATEPVRPRAGSSADVISDDLARLAAEAGIHERDPETLRQESQQEAQKHQNVLQAKQTARPLQTRGQTMSASVPRSIPGGQRADAQGTQLQQGPSQPLQVCRANLTTSREPMGSHPARAPQADHAHQMQPIVSQRAKQPCREGLPGKQVQRVPDQRSADIGRPIALAASRAGSRAASRAASPERQDALAQKLRDSELRQALSSLGGTGGRENPGQDSCPNSPTCVPASAPLSSASAPAADATPDVQITFDEAVRARDALIAYCRTAADPVPLDHIAQQAAALVKHAAAQLLRCPTHAVMAHMSGQLGHDASEADQAPAQHSIAAHVNIRKAMIPKLLTGPKELLNAHHHDRVPHMSVSMLVLELVMRLEVASIKAGPTKRELAPLRRKELLLLFEWLMSMIPTPPFGARAFFKELVEQQYSPTLPGLVRELELMAFGDDEPESSPDKGSRETGAGLDPNAHGEVIGDSERAGPSQRTATGEGGTEGRSAPAASRPTTSAMSGQNSGISHRSAAPRGAGPSSRARVAVGHKRTYHNAAKRVGMNGQALGRQVRLKGRPGGEAKPGAKPLHRLAGKEAKPKVGGGQTKKGADGQRTPRKGQKTAAQARHTPTSRRKATPASEEEEAVPATSHKRAASERSNKTVSQLKRKLAFGSIPLSYAVEEEDDEADDLPAVQDALLTTDAVKEGNGDSDSNWMTNAADRPRPPPTRPGCLMRFGSQPAPSTAGPAHQPLQHSQSLPAGNAMGPAPPVRPAADISIMAAELQLADAPSQSGLAAPPGRHMHSSSLQHPVGLPVHATLTAGTGTGAACAPVSMLMQRRQSVDSAGFSDLPALVNLAEFPALPARSGVHDTQLQSGLSLHDSARAGPQRTVSGRTAGEGMSQHRREQRSARKSTHGKVGRQIGTSSAAASQQVSQQLHSGAREATVSPPMFPKRTQPPTPPQQPLCEDTRLAGQPPAASAVAQQPDVACQDGMLGQQAGEHAQHAPPAAAQPHGEAFVPSSPAAEQASDGQPGAIHAHSLQDDSMPAIEPAQLLDTQDAAQLPPSNGAVQPPEADEQLEHAERDEQAWQRPDEYEFGNIDAIPDARYINMPAAVAKPRQRAAKPAAPATLQAKRSKGSAAASQAGLTTQASPAAHQGPETGGRASQGLASTPDLPSPRDGPAASPAQAADGAATLLEPGTAEGPAQGDTPALPEATQQPPATAARSSRRLAGRDAVMTPDLAASVVPLAAAEPPVAVQPVSTRLATRSMAGKPDAATPVADDMPSHQPITAGKAQGQTAIEAAVQLIAPAAVGTATRTNKRKAADVAASDTPAAGPAAAPAGDGATAPRSSRAGKRRAAQIETCATPATGPATADAAEPATLEHATRASKQKADGTDANGTLAVGQASAPVAKLATPGYCKAGGRLNKGADAASTPAASPVVRRASPGEPVVPKCSQHARHNTGCQRCLATLNQRKELGIGCGHCRYLGCTRCRRTSRRADSIKRGLAGPGADTHLEAGSNPAPAVDLASEERPTRAGKLKAAQADATGKPAPGQATAHANELAIARHTEGGAQQKEAAAVAATMPAGSLAGKGASPAQPVVPKCSKHGRKHDTGCKLCRDALTKRKELGIGCAKCRYLVSTCCRGKSPSSPRKAAQIQTEEPQSRPAGKAGAAADAHEQPEPSAKGSADPTSDADLPPADITRQRLAGLGAGTRPADGMTAAAQQVPNPDMPGINCQGAAGAAPAQQVADAEQLVDTSIHPAQQRAEHAEIHSLPSLDTAAVGLAQPEAQPASPANAGTLFPSLIMSPGNSALTAETSGALFAGMFSGDPMHNIAGMVAQLDPQSRRNSVDGPITAPAEPAVHAVPALHPAAGHAPAPAPPVPAAQHALAVLPLGNQRLAGASTPAEGVNITMRGTSPGDMSDISIDISYGQRDSEGIIPDSCDTQAARQTARQRQMANMAASLAPIAEERQPATTEDTGCLQAAGIAELAQPSFSSAAAQPEQDASKSRPVLAGAALHSEQTSIDDVPLQQPDRHDDAAAAGTVAGVFEDGRAHEAAAAVSCQDADLAAVGELSAAELADATIARSGGGHAEVSNAADPAAAATPMPAGGQRGDTDQRAQHALSKSARKGKADVDTPRRPPSSRKRMSPGWRKQDQLSPPDKRTKTAQDKATTFTPGGERSAKRRRAAPSDKQAAACFRSPTVSEQPMQQPAAAPLALSDPVASAAAAAAHAADTAAELAATTACEGFETETSVLDPIAVVGPPAAPSDAQRSCRATDAAALHEPAKSPHTALEAEVVAPCTFETVMAAALLPADNACAAQHQASLCAAAQSQEERLPAEAREPSSFADAQQEAAEAVTEADSGTDLSESGPAPEAAKGSNSEAASEAAMEAVQESQHQKPPPAIAVASPNVAFGSASSGAGHTPVLQSAPQASSACPQTALRATRSAAGKVVLQAAPEPAIATPQAKPRTTRSAAHGMALGTAPDAVTATPQAWSRTTRAATQELALQPVTEAPSTRRRATRLSMAMPDAQSTRATTSPAAPRLQQGTPAASQPRPARSHARNSPAGAVQQAGIPSDRQALAVRAAMQAAALSCAEGPGAEGAAVQSGILPVCEDTDRASPFTSAKAQVWGCGRCRYAKGGCSKCNPIKAAAHARNKPHASGQHMTPAKRDGLHAVGTAAQGMAGTAATPEMLQQQAAMSGPTSARQPGMQHADETSEQRSGTSVVAVPSQTGEPHALVPSPGPPVPGQPSPVVFPQPRSVIMYHFRAEACPAHFQKEPARMWKVTSIKTRTGEGSDATWQVRASEVLLDPCMADGLSKQELELHASRCRATAEEVAAEEEAWCLVEQASSPGSSRPSTAGKRKRQHTSCAERQQADGHLAEPLPAANALGHDACQEPQRSREAAAAEQEGETPAPAMGTTPCDGTEADVVASDAGVRAGRKSQRSRAAGTSEKPPDAAPLAADQPEEAEAAAAGAQRRSQRDRAAAAMPEEAGQPVDQNAKGSRQPQRASAEQLSAKAAPVMELSPGTLRDYQRQGAGLRSLRRSDGV